MIGTKMELVTILVAPFAGAWIEIRNKSIMHPAENVAPFAGAWIEMPKCKNTIRELKSLPSRERGLKYVTPFVYVRYSKSLPSRERGLKLYRHRKKHGKIESLPSRERGLKSFAPALLQMLHLVAPLAGAWIEIFA